MTPELIVWDFDGVINANTRAGRFFWTDMLQADLGIDPEALSAHLFASGRMRNVITGAADLRDLLSEWLSSTGMDTSADALLAYWFENDAHPDAEVLGWIAQSRARHVIGTNNEPRRASYIERSMPVTDHITQVFASGRMGVAKPDAAFFTIIADWAGLPADRILMVDDHAPNVAAAQALGWQGFHFTPETRAALPMQLGLT